MPSSVFNGDAVKILKNKLRFKDGAEITSTEAGYIAGVTSDIQTQLNAKAATDLSNLAATTAINSNLLFTSTNTVVLSNNVALQGIFGSARDIIKITAAGRIEVGDSARVIRVTGDLSANTDGTTQCGTNLLRWSNVSSDQFEGAGGLTIAPATTPSGIGSVSSIQTAVMIDGGVLTSSDNNADAIKSGDLFFETGNKTNASATAGTGELFFKSGDASGSSGDSGGLHFETGTSANGARGNIFFDEESIDTASVGYIWTLQNTTTGEGAWATVPSGGNKSVASYSSATTASISDEVILLSGASFTLGLPTAVSATGKVFEIVHNGTSLSQVYTLNPNGTETIRGLTSFLMHTNGQRLRICSDGSNWVVLGHDTETEWTSVGTLTINATTTNPTKGATQTIDDVRYRRIGDSAHIRMYFKQSSASGSNPGSGDYLFDVSAVGSIDTTKVETYSTIEGWNSTYVNIYSVGTGGHGGNFTGVSGASTGAIVPYDSTQVRVFSGSVNTTGGTLGSSGYPLTGADVWYSLDFIVPIDGWEY